MPNRLIRDGLLESEAVLSLLVEARWLFVSILLSADDVGLFECTPFKLARRADMKREVVERLVPMLADADLIRLYPGQGQRVFGFIPKFGQRLQIKRARYPLPPLPLLAGDEDAVKKIKHLASEATVERGDSRFSTVAKPSEPEPEAEPEEKGNRKINTAPRKRAAPAAPSVVLDSLALVSAGVTAQHASEWLAIRKAKKLTLTRTALDDVMAEAEKAGVSLDEAIATAIVNSWGGFRAEWLRRDGPRAPSGRQRLPLNRQEALEADAKRVGREWLEQQGQQA